MPNQLMRKNDPLVLRNNRHQILLEFLGILIAGEIHPLVGTLRGENRGDQQLKGVLVFESASRRWMRFVELGQNCSDPLRIRTGGSGRAGTPVLRSCVRGLPRCSDARIFQFLHHQTLMAERANYSTGEDAKKSTSLRKALAR